MWVILAMPKSKMHGIRLNKEQEERRVNAV
jgi:hypothetical protein